MNIRFLFILLVAGVVFTSTAFAQLPSIPETLADTLEEHQPGAGVQLIKRKKIELNFAFYASARYLNQMSINDSFKDAFDRTHKLDPRNDLQFQKVTLFFMGWLNSPKFRYLMYIWTSNANLGQGAQVVVAGNLQYKVNKYFEAGLGIVGLPATRSLYGQWPFWLRQDARPMAEEFFRASYTTGISMQGEIAKGLRYKTMLGNNLSQLGVDAGQLDQGFDTWSTALWWTTNNFGKQAPFGDFERHEKVATIVGASYTRSNETRQSQPGTNDPANSQIRLSDGTGVFELNSFKTGSQVLAAKYQMACANSGLKFKGLSLDGEYFFRWISAFETLGQIPVSRLFDNGFAVQASGMVIDKTLQLYAVYSYIDGQYGKPWEVNVGLNWYAFKSRIFRLNPEIIFAHHSPVGYAAYPTLVGTQGTVYMINLELFY